MSRNHVHYYCTGTGQLRINIIYGYCISVKIIVLYSRLPFFSSADDDHVFESPSSCGCRVFFNRISVRHCQRHTYIIYEIISRSEYSAHVLNDPYYLECVHYKVSRVNQSLINTSFCWPFGWFLRHIFKCSSSPEVYNNYTVECLRQTRMRMAFLSLPRNFGQRWQIRFLNSSIYYFLRNKTKKNKIRVRSVNSSWRPKYYSCG